MTIYKFKRALMTTNTLAKVSSEKMLIGKIEGKLETVKKLLASGIETQAIVKFIDLSYEQVSSLKAC